MEQIETLNTIIFQENFNGYNFNPDLSRSNRYVHRISIEDNRRCHDCWDKEGCIFTFKEHPVHFFDHPNCRCFTDIMNAIKAGTATVDGINGADYIKFFKNELPDYYVLYDRALALGWKKKFQIVGYNTWSKCL